MSLINDALKKAQRQRSEGNPSAAEVTSQNAAPEQLHRVARREKPAGFRSQVMLIGGGAAAAVVLLAIGAVFFFRSGEPPPALPAQPTQIATAPTAVPSVPATQTAPTVSPAALVPALPAASTPSPAPAQQLTLTDPAAPTPSPASGQFVLPPAPVTETAAIATTTPTAPTPAVADRPKPSTRMIGVIERFRVGGIRVAGTESKVLMNDKVYRLNDTIDHELGIRLTGIETKALTFEDSRGAVHTRTF